MSRPADHDGDRDPPLGHDDGLPAPARPGRRPWLWLLAIPIVGSAAYYASDQLGPRPAIVSGSEAHAKLTATHETRAVAAAAPASETRLRQLQHDAHAMAMARDAFVVRCAACHGPEGQGLTGPNLSDDHWIHGHGLAAIRQVIADGIPDKGMVSWKSHLEPADIEAIAAFVGTLRGTRPPNPKPPEGHR
jgi:cytochrome c oxidase cbb3-type subunit 3